MDNNKVILKTMITCRASPTGSIEDERGNRVDSTTITAIMSTPQTQ